MMFKNSGKGKGERTANKPNQPTNQTGLSSALSHLSQSGINF